MSNNVANHVSDGNPIKNQASPLSPYRSYLYKPLSINFSIFEILYKRPHL